MTGMPALPASPGWPREKYHPALFADGLAHGAGQVLRQAGD